MGVRPPDRIGKLSKGRNALEQLLDMGELRDNRRTGTIAIAIGGPGYVKYWERTEIA